MRHVDLGEASVAVRYRRLLTLWIGMMMSIVIWFVLTRWLEVRNPEKSAARITGHLFQLPTDVIVVFGQTGTGWQSDRSAGPQVTSTSICGCLGAVRDSCVTQIIGALRGLIATLLNAAFVIAGGGMLLHFPQRRHVLAAFGQEF